MTLELFWAFRVRPVLGLVICIPVVMEKVGIGTGGYFGAILPCRTEPNRCRDCKGESEIFKHEKDATLLICLLKLILKYGPSLC